MQFSMITPKKWDQLKERMDKLHIHDTDLEEDFIHGSGSGGQKINKTSSCVVLKHIPTGLHVKCQKERSRESNRYFARVLLCDKYEKEILGQKTKKDKELEKIRKQKDRRRRRSTKEKDVNF